MSKLSLYGVSYGTRTATAYALRYPARVQRLGLDSVTAVDGADALSVDSFRAVPRVLRTLCGGPRCDRFSRDPVADVGALVQRIGAGGPLRGTLPDRRGRPRAATLSRYDVFSTLVSGDFEASLRTDYPAAVKAALRGDPAPLLRLKRRSIALESGGFEPAELSTALYAATTCEEARLPWPRGTPFAQRRPRGCRGRGSAGAGADRALRRRNRPGLGRDRPVLAVARVAARPHARPRARCPTCPRCWWRAPTTCAPRWRPPAR